MGWYVHLHVCFSCDSNEGVAVLARRHLERLGDDYPKRQAIWFLTDLANRTGENPGPKGGLSLWGMVVNGKEVPHDFVQQLEPFWRDLLRGDIDGGPAGHHRIIIMYEEEQSEAANAYEIGWEDDWPDHWGNEWPVTDGWVDDRVLFIRHHGPLPFAWRQY
jgi:hypothetical protein